VTTNDALVALFLNETLADNLDEAPDESAAEPKDRSTVSSELGTCNWCSERLWNEVLT
jgi:hypothetical protein